MSEKIVLIDGNSILNRAFYGLPDLSNADGLHTNAIYGFLMILFKVLEEEKAAYAAIAFDLKAPTFRHLLYKEYKGTRKGMPDELREQVPVMKQVLKAMGFVLLEKEGLEADDILGTIAKRSEAEGYEVSVISGDRDLLQLASEHIKIRIPKTKGGRTEVEDYNDTDVIDKYGVTPKQFIDVKALMGDTSDNIPGVPKIGEKTATSLIMQYGSLENVLDKVNEIDKKSVRETITEHVELANLSKILATIEINAELDFSLETAKLGDIYTQEAYLLFKQLEFKNLLERFQNKETGSEEKPVFKYINSFPEAEEILNKALQNTEVGFQWIEEDRLLGLSISLSDKETYFIEIEGFITKDYVTDKLLKLKDKGITLATFHFKQALNYLNLTDMHECFDIKIGAYLLNPLKNDYDIDDIAKEFLGLTIKTRTETFGKLSLDKAKEENPSLFLEYACYFSFVARKAYSVMEERLETESMHALFHEMEMPLIITLHDMEKAGIKTRAESLKIYSEQLNDKIEELEKEIFEMAGESFNINSPKQLGEVLFDHLKLPNGKKTKTGYSTAADVLEKLAGDYPIVNKILEYRQAAKLKSTYADGLAAYIEEDGRIHSNFNQTITATGRISSTEPNLQNIPIKMEIGRLIRKVFVPEEGYVFLDADYSQIELRVLAHMSGDEKLIEAYQNGLDIHRTTASEVFHVPFDEVTSLQRSNAKAVNFGIVYGISAFGLSEDLHISRKEAQDYIQKYFDTYPNVKVFMDTTVEKAKEEGFVATMFGRRRPIPELKSTNFMQRSFGERIAMNSPIQGTAADIIKIAMIQVNEELKNSNLKSRLILQVHDELLIETHKDEIQIVSDILKDKMQNAAKLSVPLVIDVNMGNNWYEAK